jgi:hypothetical protein
MWIIDADHTAEHNTKPGTNMNAVDMKSADYDPALDNTLTEPFRLLDADGEVYYEGRSTNSDSEEAFSPLDDFGTPNAGCTEIQYFKGDRWETL